jgi:type II secretory pathway pseudopilin PulG
MAALLVGMSVAAVLMTAVMPVWKQMTKRERETELVFRGQQYVRAIGLFQKRAGPGVLPPNLDVLVTGRFLRKKFKDPITNQDFDLLSPTQAAGQAGAAQQVGAAQQPATGRGAQPATTGQGRVIGAQGGAAGGGATGGVIGVASKSKEESLRIFNGRTHYNEWQFLFVQQATPGQGGAGGAARGGAPGGGRGTQPPQPGGGVGGGGGRGGQGRGLGPFGPGGAGQPPPTPQQPGPFVAPRPR